MIGLLFVPRSSCIFTYIMEISPDKYHEVMTLAVYIGDGLTFVISGLFVKYTRDVYLYLVLLSLLTVFCVVLLWIFLPESPRFLYSKSRYEELYSNFAMIARMNKIKDENLIDNMIESLKRAKDEDNYKYEKKCLTDL